MPERKSLKYPKILLTGSTGQVGGELMQSLQSFGNLWAPPRDEFDLAKPESLRSKIQEHRPDLIVNCAAYTAVDKAELESSIAYAANAESPRVMAAEAQKLHIPLIHYSTDYVFDGEKGEPYFEEDIPAPLSVYGETKLAGERAIQETQGQYLILRTSWVYSPRGRNFLTTMLRLFQEREEVRVVDDQVGAPTSATMLAEVTVQILRKLKVKEEDRWGLYHLTAKGQASWYGFAKEILTMAKKDSQRLPGLTVKAIHPIPTSDYPTPARRPRNSRLDTSKAAEGFQIEFASWQNGLLTHDLSYDN